MQSLKYGGYHNDMNALRGKIPFFYLLLPVVAGILTASQVHAFSCFFWIGLAGIGAMLLAIVFSSFNPYPFRWLFGAGTMLFLFFIATVSCRLWEEHTEFSFPPEQTTYMGYVSDIPQEKPKSMACNIAVSVPVRKNVVLYLQKNAEARSLSPGEEIVFSCTMQPFRNLGNPDDFDYVRYMQINGFSGSSYIPETHWKKTGRQKQGIAVLAQHIRLDILGFYRSLELSPDAYAFISALTLGYKALLTDDLQEAFRVSGTAHVLAVSGLHVGIIYIIFNLFFSFLGTSGRKYRMRQWAVIAMLWLYVFVTGLPMPVVRAGVMLTIYCVGKICRRKGFNYNTLAATAFLMLIVHPSGLFDVGFQMSFASVFAILFFQPKLNALFPVENRFKRSVRNLATISLAAQLGVFPLVLYYFGTFPTYFFLANLVIVPLTTLITYAVFPLIPLFFCLQWHIPFFDRLFTVCTRIVQALIDGTLQSVYWVESLPLSQLSGVHISFVQVFCLYVFILMITSFFIRPRARSAFIALSAALIFLLSRYMM
ncbi:MAG TPA: hypothetical protein DDW85_02110 [Porphyromonadaceae bacterium]|nr:hypothetical protein [Porphyromonadaceae bacterium]